MSLSLLPKAVPILARHLGAYVELTAAEAAVLARSLAQRLLAAVIALLGVVFALLISCVWLISAVWNTPWRNPTLAAMLLLFTGLAVVGSVLAARRWKAGSEPFSTLRREWESDRQLIGGLAVPESDAVVPVTSPLERLEQTRDELKRLLGEDGGPYQTDVFPRSATMRFLVGTSGKGVASTVAIAALSGFMPKAVRGLLSVVPIGALTQLLFRQRGAGS